MEAEIDTGAARPDGGKNANRDVPENPDIPVGEGGLREDRFINRELSWLAFNERVLEEAANETHPLFERLRFLSISDNNLNEFFAVRVAGLKNQVCSGVLDRSADGLSPIQQLQAVNTRAAALMEEQQSTWVNLRKLLAREGIEIVEAGRLRRTDGKWLDTFFMDEVYPVLTPVAIDPAHPFPFIPNFGFTIALTMEQPDDTDPLIGLISIPQGLPRFVRLPGRKFRFIAIETVISLFLDRLFPGVAIQSHGVFQIIRDSDIEVEEEAEDLVLFYEAAIRKRRRGSVIRLALDAALPEDMREFLIAQLRVDQQDAFPVSGLVSLVDISELITDERPDLLFRRFTARFPERIRDYQGDCFAAIR